MRPRSRYRNGRAKCPRCGRVTAYAIPSKGDGSVELYFQHKDPASGERCDNSRAIVQSADVVTEPAGWKPTWGAF